MNNSLKLENILHDLGSALVAYSGGVDSALLLACAHSVLGGNVLAVTAVSEIMTDREIIDAQELAQQLGVRHVLVPAGDLDNPDFVKNSPERCYYCKKHRFLLMKELAQKHNLRWVVEGSNLDDFNDYRPGLRAVREMGVRSPLLEAGFSKAEVREMAKEMGLSVWNKPSEPCLATRIPYNRPITRAAVERINKAEAFLAVFLGQGSRQVRVRVRDHGDIARLEIPPEFYPLVCTAFAAQTIYREMRSLGYTYTALDLLGYRQGSMNESI